MGRLIVPLVLLLWLTIVFDAAPLPVVFVTVQHADGTVSSWDEGRRGYVLDEVNAALNYFRIQGVMGLPQVAEPQGELTVEDLSTWDWVPQVSGLRLYVVSTEGHPDLRLANGRYGASWRVGPRTGTVLTLDHYGPVAEDLRAIIAHELGHGGLMLPDFESPPCSTDLMCQPQRAVRANTLGCWTREALGMPCTRIYLPEVTQ